MNCGNVIIEFLLSSISKTFFVLKLTLLRLPNLISFHCDFEGMLYQSTESVGNSMAKVIAVPFLRCALLIGKNHGTSLLNFIPGLFLYQRLSLSISKSMRLLI